MRIFHISPHFGGGILPSVLGIVEAIEARHTLIQLDQTLNKEIIEKLKFHQLIPELLTNDSSLFNSVPDFIIFHFWETEILNRIKVIKHKQFRAPIILLHHQTFDYGSSKLSKIQNNFSALVQSGFIKDKLQDNWFLVPTCKSFMPSPIEVPPRTSKVLYIGTLSYKKIDQNFLNIANKVCDIGFEIDVYGQKNSSSFHSDLKNINNPKLRYLGFAENSYSLMLKYSYLLYPLRKKHYGTTENVLLEAMNAGVIPFINRQNPETFIIGRELAHYLTLGDNFEQNLINIHSNPRLKAKIQESLMDRALLLTSLPARKSIWGKILETAKNNVRNINFSNLLT